MRKKTPQLLITFILLILGATSSNSADNIVSKYQKHEDIRLAVKGFLDQNLHEIKGVKLETQIKPIDSRLRLSQCGKPLTTFSRSQVNQSAKFSVGVMCKDKKPWSLYVAVEVKKIATLYTAATPISRGEPITADNITKTQYDINRLRRGFYQNKSELIGMIAKRSMRSGTVISAKHLLPPTIIKKGDPISIVAKTGSIAIRMTGKAMSNGAKGQRIRVRNNSSKRIIDAIVKDSATVQVTL